MGKGRGSSMKPRSKYVKKDGTKTLRRRESDVLIPEKAYVRYAPVIDPTTGKKTCLLDKIEELLLWGAKRPEIVYLTTQAPFSASTATIDRAIREAKDNWLSELERTRASRVAKNRRRLERIAEKAFGLDDLANARGGIMDMCKLTGDLAPETHILLGGDKSPEDLLKQAEELKVLALRQEEED